MVENDGFEPTASALQKRRSPNWANSPKREMGMRELSIFNQILLLSEYIGQ